MVVIMMVVVARVQMLQLSHGLAIYVNIMGLEVYNEFFSLIFRIRYVSFYQMINYVYLRSIRTLGIS